MKVVVTGAFGNLGASALQELLRQGHTVRAFGRPSRRATRLARRFAGSVDIAWGDVRSRRDVARAVHGQDVVVHLAYVLPPASEDDPTRAQAINVGGTATLIDVARDQPQPPRFLFASSFDVFGPTQNQAPPRRASDPVQATDAYSHHKLACEEAVRTSGLEWAIFRFADVPPLAGRRPHPIMFRIPLETRFEVLHPHDAGLAIANALHCPEVWGTIVLIGGGASCQVRYRDYLGAMLDAMGIGPIPEEAFGHEPYCTDWLDTTESQRWLTYQRHTFADVIHDVTAAAGPARHLAPLVRPLVRSWILHMSPYYRA